MHDPREDLADANQCVMCGLCLPHCPTYGLNSNEADSPRGRLSLMLGLHSGALTPDGDVAAHLNSCLGCRACETMCPSLVPYGRLIDAARQVLDDEGEGNPVLTRWRDELLSRRGRLSTLMTAQALSDRVGLGGLTRRLGGELARPLPRRLPWPSNPFGHHRPEREAVGRVGLFIGCAGTSLDADSSRAARRLLTAFGFEVIVPRRQDCCGAMHRHGGAPAQADERLERSRAAFANLTLDAIVGLSTACVAEWREQAAANNPPIREISEFLNAQPAERWPTLKALEGKLVAIHLPCSQRNVLREPMSVHALLARIPGLKQIDLDGNAYCCGSAGLQRFDHPEQAAALRAPKLRHIEQSRPDFIVSANVGCAMHLNAGLDALSPRPAEVIHPITLLAACLDQD